jgi:hypothetical protein
MSTQTQKAPFWWRGTPGEWNSIPEGDRALAHSMSGEARDREAARLLALARNERYAPEKAAATEAKPEVHFAGIRNWTESVNGISAERIRDCIIFLLDVQRDPWYVNNCNNRAFVKRFVHKMDEQTPEDYHYDPNAVLGTKRRHIDGENQPMVQVVVQKEQGTLTDKDRKELRDKYGVTDSTAKYLAKPDCPRCHGKVFVDVSDYPDDPQFRVLASWKPCACLWE